MRKSRFTEEQIRTAVEQTAAGAQLSIYFSGVNQIGDV
jgi:hypothetical protein